MIEAGQAKWALVTGAAGGIGRELARGLSVKGYSIFAVDRDGEALDVLGKELVARKSSCEFKALPMDLAAPDAAEKLYTAVRECSIGIDLLVNNVGFGKMGEHVLQSPEDMTSMLSLNNLLLTKLCLLFGRDMKARKSGKILNVASLVGFSASPFFAAYSGTKAYVIAFSVALARELGEHGVQVSCLCPGTTATNFLDTAEIDDISSKGMRSFASAFVATPQTVAEAGIRGLEAGKLVIVPTLFLRVQAFFLGTLSPVLVSGFVHRKIMRANRAAPMETSR